MKSFFESLDPSTIIGTIAGILLLALLTWVVERWIRQYKQEPTITKPIGGGQWAPSSYLTDLIKRASALSFGDTAAWSHPNSSRGSGLITLEQVWTPLRAAD